MDFSKLPLSISSVFKIPTIQQVASALPKYEAPQAPVATKPAAPPSQVFPSGAGLNDQYNVTVKGKPAKTTLALTPEQKTGSLDSGKGYIPSEYTSQTDKAINLLKATFQVPARAMASIGIPEGSQLQPRTGAERFFFGDEPITPIADVVAGREQALLGGDGNNLGWAALPLAFGTTVLGTAIDLFPAGPPEFEAPGVFRRGWTLAEEPKALSSFADMTMTQGVDGVWRVEQGARAAETAKTAEAGMESVAKPAQSPGATIIPKIGQGEAIVPKVGETTPKAEASLIKSESPLSQEATKYKSAEEFVKGQPTYYRGGSSLGNVDSQGGIYLTSSSDGAKTFGTVIHEYNVNIPESKILDLRKSVGGKEQMTQLLKDAGLEPYRDYYGSLPNNFSDFAKKKQFVNYIKSLGKYDAVKFDDSMFNGKQAMDSFVVFNKDAIQTKSQLIDIWNKANKGNSLAQEAKKYKSAEEFVNKGTVRVYRGIESGDLRKGINANDYVTTDKTIAESYAGKNGTVVEKTVPVKHLSGGETAKEQFYTPTKEAIEKTNQYFRNNPTLKQSQLIDIWNKANEKPAKVGGPPVAKSPTQTFNVGLTNVAGRDVDFENVDGVWKATGKGATQSDTIMAEAKTLYDAGKYTEAQMKYNEAVNFGIRKVQEAFTGTGIKIKTKPGFGTFEGQIEPNIDFSAVVPKGKEDLFHHLLAGVADTTFGQKSLITYRGVSLDSPMGLVDEARQIYHEPSARFILKQPASVADVEALNKIMDSVGLKAGSFKDGGKTIDIVNLTHYNKDPQGLTNYDQFQQQLGAFGEALNRKGLLQSYEDGISETRHIGSDAGNAPITYKRVQGDFLTQNPGFKPKGTKASQQFTSKFLDRLPQKPTISKGEVLQILKMPDVSATEKMVVGDALAKQKDQINTQDLAYRVRKNLLQITPEYSDAYTDYGYEHLGMRIQNEKTIELHTGVETGVKMHGMGSDLFGHYRTFEPENYNAKVDGPVKSNEVLVSEIQADSFQQGLNMPTVADTITRADAGKRQIEKDIKEMEADMAQAGGKATYNSNAGRIVKLKQQLATDQLIYDDLKAQQAKGQKFMTTADTQLVDARRALAEYQQGLARELAKPDNEPLIKGRRAGIAEEEKRIADLEKKRTKEAIATNTGKAEQMINFAKNDKYRGRQLEEVLTNEAKKGYKAIYLPTPSTVARIEWGMGGIDDANMMPYETNTPTGDDLTHGDTIDYGGDEYTVVGTDNGGIEVAPSDKVHTFKWSDYQDEEASNAFDNASSEIETFAKQYGDLNNPEVAQTILDEHKGKSGKQGFESWELQNGLEIVAAGESTDLEQAIKDYALTHADLSNLEEIYGRGNVFSHEIGPRGYDSQIYIVEEGTNPESFEQPSSYNAFAGQDFTHIDKDRESASKSFSKDQMSVLDNYYEMQKNLDKIQKNTDIQVEYVEKEDENGNPITWFKIIPNNNLRNLKKTAF